MKIFALLSTLFLFINSEPNPTSDQIVGRWMSEQKDLAVEVYKVDGHYAGKVVWFDCSRPGTPPMAEHRDTENPNPRLRSRSWLGMNVLNDLRFNGTDEWNSGTVYDPNSGRTYRTVVRMASPKSIIVRGYWGIEFLGKNMRFNKVAQ